MGRILTFCSFIYLSTNSLFEREEDKEKQKIKQKESAKIKTQRSTKMKKPINEYSKFVTSIASTGMTRS